MGVGKPIVVNRVTCTVASSYWWVPSAEPPFPHPCAGSDKVRFGLGTGPWAIKSFAIVR